MTARYRSFSPATTNTGASFCSKRTDTGVSRRQLLLSSSAIAANLLIGRYGRAERAGSGTPFTLGVASGDPAPDGFVLWTRLAPHPLAPDGSGGLAAPVTVAWEIATDDTMRHVVQSRTVEADR